MKRLSIIIAIYNVENYVHQCLDSIFRQGLDENDFEVIIINDGTEDNSINVITDIVNQHQNITIINQENQGSSIAWNNGIDIANGEFILIVDADDLLIERRLKPLLEKAMETKADIVVANFIELDDEKITETMLSHLNSRAMDVLYQEKTGHELFLEDLHPSQCYVWRKLYKRSFLKEKHLTFVPGILFQDIPFTNECYLIAGKCIKATQPLYIYRKRNLAVTYAYSVKKGLDNTIAIAKTWELLSRYPLSGKIKEKLQNNVFNNFINFSRRVSRLSKDYKERESIYEHLRQNAPNMHFKNNMKQALISFLFWHSATLYNYASYYYVRIVQNTIIPHFRSYLNIIRKKRHFFHLFRKERKARHA